MSKKDKNDEYSRLKKSLEMFGYNEPLGLDSVLLANKLLADLTRTTEAFQKLQNEKVFSICDIGFASDGFHGLLD